MPYFNEPNDCRGWWTSRTGLEQKLIILSTILFIVCFSLTITVIVYKNRSSSGDCTTVAPPTTETGSTPVSVTGSDSTTASSPETSPTTPVSESTPATTVPETTPTSPVPETTPTSPTPSAKNIGPDTTETTIVPPQPFDKKEAAPIERSEASALISLLKEANRVNGVLEKLKEEERLRGA